MYGYNYLYDDNHYYSRQLPTASTSPGYPTMHTSPINNMLPSGLNFSGISPSNTAPVSPSAVSAAPVLQNPGYTQAFLKTQIGKRVRIDFLIGTNTLIDRGGTLEEVGISYVVLRDNETNDKVLGDLYSIKFVTIFE